MSQNNNLRGTYTISQNFLTSRRTLEQLVKKAGLDKKDTVLEIGAGKGHITKLLAQTCREVIAYEIDPVLYERLVPQLASNVRLYQMDFLKAALPQQQYKVFANIPFSRTTEIIRKLTNGVPPPQEMYLVMEKGAALRFCGCPVENLNSLMMRPFFEMRIIHRFERTDFHPVPRVDCVMLAFAARAQPDIPAVQRRAYHDFLRYCFRYGLYGKRALLTKKQIATALKLEGLPQLTPSGTMLYVQWLCLFRCWLKYGKKIPE